MSDREILEKAIQKAIDGGWEKPQPTDAHGLVYSYINAPQVLLFNHDFAKALWGDGYALGHHEVLNIPAWQYYLQQMVIADDPIQYLGENI